MGTKMTLRNLRECCDSSAESRVDGAHDGLGLAEKARLDSGRRC